MRRKKGSKAPAAFMVLLLGAALAVERAPASMLPCPACRFFGYLKTEEASGERLGLWDRITASFVLTGDANKKARDRAACPGPVAVGNATS